MKRTTSCMIVHAADVEVHVYFGRVATDGLRRDVRGNIYILQGQEEQLAVVGPLAIKSFDSRHLPSYAAPCAAPSSTRRTPSVSRTSSVAPLPPHYRLRMIPQWLPPPALQCSAAPFPAIAQRCSLGIYNPLYLGFAERIFPVEPNRDECRSRTLQQRQRIRCRILSCQPPVSFLPLSYAALVRCSQQHTAHSFRLAHQLCRSLPHRGQE